MYWQEQSRLKKLILCLVPVSFLLTASCNDAVAEQSSIEIPNDYGEWGIDLSAIDDSVDPGDDFYRFVNGGWLDATTIPDGYARWNALDWLGRSNEVRVAEMVSELEDQKNLEAGSAEQQIADFYRSYLDVEARNSAGVDPVRDLINTYSAVDDRESLLSALASPDATSPVGFAALPDAANPERTLLTFFQGGLTMPDPVYYLGEGEELEATRAAFLDYGEALFEAADMSEPRQRAERVLAMETAIAEKHWSLEEMRNGVRMYNLMTVGELQQFAPDLDWATMIELIGAEDVNEVVVNTDTAVRDLATLMAETPYEDWQDYLVFHALDGYSEFLHDDLVGANFRFYSTALAGVESQRPIEERAIATTAGAFGDLVGQLYAERYFTPDDRERVETMIGFLVAEYRDRFENNEWMDDATRAEAISKLDQVVTRIGYPDQYPDMSSIRVEPDDVAGNLRRLMQWIRTDNLAQLREPTRKWVWPFSVHEVNAAYMPAQNSISFPAGILQPPFYHPDGDIAVNFGSIGAVIGHELGHGFDDQGKSYDGIGALRNWWTPESEANFRERSDRLVDQFSSYSPIEGGNVNGALTLGENIGDLGGLTVGYAAYQRYVDAKQGGEAPVLDGFTGNQRFFLSWGQVWRTLTRPEEIRRRLVADVHSPPQFRANGAVRNVDGWYEAFDVGPNDALYLPPEERVRIW